jgi:hypothetical protein
MTRGVKLGVRMIGMRKDKDLSPRTCGSTEDRRLREHRARGDVRPLPVSVEVVPL